MGALGASKHQKPLAKRKLQYSANAEANKEDLEETRASWKGGRRKEAVSKFAPST